MGKQLKFYLTEEEAQRLYYVAGKQCRRPHEQARFIILSALGLTDTQKIIVNAESDTTGQGKRVALSA